MVFWWSISNCKSHQISRNHLSILADHNNAAVEVVSIHLLIFNSTSPFSKPLGTVLRAPITISFNTTLMFNNVLSSLAKYKYFTLVSLDKVKVLYSLFTFFLFFSFPLCCLLGQLTSLYLRYYFFFAIFRWIDCKLFLDFVNYRLIRSSFCISKSLKIRCISFSKTGSGLCIYMVKFQLFALDHLSYRVVF